MLRASELPFPCMMYSTLLVTSLLLMLSFNHLSLAGSTLLSISNEPRRNRHSGHPVCTVCTLTKALAIRDWSVNPPATPSGLPFDNLLFGPKTFWGLSRNRPQFTSIHTLTESSCSWKTYNSLILITFLIASYHWNLFFFDGEGPLSIKPSGSLQITRK